MPLLVEGIDMVYGDFLMQWDCVQMVILWCYFGVFLICSINAWEFWLTFWKSLKSLLNFVLSKRSRILIRAIWNFVIFGKWLLIANLEDLRNLYFHQIWIAFSQIFLTWVTAPRPCIFGIWIVIAFPFIAGTQIRISFCLISWLKQSIFALNFELLGEECQVNSWYLTFKSFYPIMLKTATAGGFDP